MTERMSKRHWRRVLAERQREAAEARTALALAVEAAHADGMSLRELGEVLYVSHTTASRIIERRCA